ncbi:hypothetical protein FDI21_gp244 [Pseudomonas phage Noxifer]|uniref:Uncharacterized protein n=1 Tax=Pseudomonas phage Noxifer TaxID=2006684 RepID=A0A1Y0T3I5_9CAUD|nr:hypothetical protein FDI21_gp244 [Pseudomonas phage Noxifer]ARV77467.1 hypothetical protein NOXIFER_302 [Pseudomonas phage Noxifer]
MNADTIYVVIVANRIIQRRLSKLFNAALACHDLNVTESSVPGLPTFIEDPYNRETMRFQFSEHALRLPMVAVCARNEGHEDIVTPPIPDTPFHSQVFISVVGTIHSGKTAVIRELENALKRDEIPEDRICRYTLDYPSDDAVLTTEQHIESIANMRARNIVLLYQPPRRMTHMKDVFTNCGYKFSVSEES